MNTNTQSIRNELKNSQDVNLRNLERKLTDEQIAYLKKALAPS